MTTVEMMAILTKDSSSDISLCCALSRLRFAFLMLRAIALALRVSYAARYRACASRNSRVIAGFLRRDCRGITTPCGFDAVPLTRALIWMTHRILAALAATECSHGCKPWFDEQLHD